MLRPDPLSEDIPKSARPCTIACRTDLGTIVFADMCRAQRRSKCSESVVMMQVAAAEEAVLWDLTTQVIDAADTLGQLLDMVRTLPLPAQTAPH